MEVTKGKRGGLIEEAATSTTITIDRETATSMTSDEPGMIGKEIKRIMTSQISARGKEAVAPEDSLSKRRESKEDKEDVAIERKS